MISLKVVQLEVYIGNGSLMAKFYEGDLLVEFQMPFLFGGGNIFVEMIWRQLRDFEGGEWTSDKIIVESVIRLSQLENKDMGITWLQPTDRWIMDANNDLSKVEVYGLALLNLKQAGIQLAIAQKQRDLLSKNSKY